MCVSRLEVCTVCMDGFTLGFDLCFKKCYTNKVIIIVIIICVNKNTYDNTGKY